MQPSERSVQENLSFCDSLLNFIKTFADSLSGSNSDDYGLHNKRNHDCQAEQSNMVEEVGLWRAKQHLRLMELA